MRVRPSQRTELALSAAALLLVLAPGCTSLSANKSLDGKALVAERCSRCHPMEAVTSAHKDRAGWETTIRRMRSNGLVVTDEQAAAIVTYLTQRDGGQ